MSLCIDEDNSFTFHWRVENFTSSADRQVNSPMFLVQALDKTAWYCFFNPERGFDLHRASTDDGPDDIEIEAKLCLFRKDGTSLVGEIQRDSLSKGSVFEVLNLKEDGIEWKDYADRNGVLRVRVHLWRASSAGESEFPWDRRAFVPCLLTGDSRLKMEDISPASVLDRQWPKLAYPRSCSGVTRCNAETISVRLDKEALQVLKQTKELSTLVASASGSRPIFCVECSVDGDSCATQIRIRKITKTKEGHFLRCRISLQDALGKTCFKKERKVSFDEAFHSFGKSDLFPEEPDNPPSRSLLLVFTLDHKYIEDTSYAPSRQAQQLTREPTASFSLQQCLLDLYREGKYFDVTLKTGEEEEDLEAHKTVLDAISPVFAAMFNFEAVERDSREADITDVDRATMTRFLEFAYSGTVEDLTWVEALDLYFAADKYQVLPLRDLCSCTLSNNLSAENVCEVLVVADLHQDQDLKDSVLDFLSADKSKFLYSEKWREFSKEISKLAHEVLLELYKKKVEQEKS